jgi:serine protease Do
VPADQAAAPKPDERTETIPAMDFRRQFIAAAKAIGPAVVSINATSTVESRSEISPFEGTPFEFFFRDVPLSQGPRVRRGIGSGTIVDRAGHILTNNHVVADAEQVKVVLADNRELEARVIGTDPKTDIAVVKVDPGAAKLQAAVLGDSRSLQVGEWVMACGSPFGLRQTVSAGIVSAVGRGNVGISDYEDFVQTDAAINPGNSGGPLVDLSGRVIGINTAIASRSGGNVGVGFAIPIEMAAHVMHQLLEHGKVTRGYIGLYITDLGEPMARSFGYPGRGGALVQDVDPDGPAARADVQPGDIIVKRDGDPVSSSAELRNAIAATAPSTEVALTVWRDGKTLAKSVRLGTLPGAEPAQREAAADSTSDRWGVHLSDIPSALRSRTRSQQGALVTLVQPSSPAEDAGLRPGDILIDVGGATVASAANAERLLRSAKSPVRVRIIRDGRGSFLVLSAKES